MYGLIEYSTVYEPVGSCSGKNTQRWIEEVVKPTPWVEDWISKKEQEMGTTFDLNQNFEDLKSLVTYAIENDKTELCMAACAGNFGVTILPALQNYLHYGVLSFSSAPVFFSSCKGRNGGSNDVVGVPIMSGLCLIVVSMLASSISVTVVSAQAGCWSWYAQGPCRDPNILPRHYE